MKIIARVLITALALLLVAELIPGIVVEGLFTAIVAAVILGLLNLIARPILVVLTLPITILTLGLFIFIINAALFAFVASFIEGFEVSGFLPAILGSLLVSVVSAIGNKFIE
jgi:putative membrane protein